MVAIISIIAGFISGVVAAVVFQLITTGNEEKEIRKLLKKAKTATIAAKETYKTKLIKQIEKI